MKFLFVSLIILCWKLLLEVRMNSVISSMMESLVRKDMVFSVLVIR